MPGRVWEVGWFEGENWRRAFVWANGHAAAKREVWETRVVNDGRWRTYKDWLRCQLVSAKVAPEPIREGGAE